MSGGNPRRHEENNGIHEHANMVSSSTCTCYMTRVFSCMFMRNILCIWWCWCMLALSLPVQEILTRNPITAEVTPCNTSHGWVSWSASQACSFGFYVKDPKPWVGIGLVPKPKVCIFYWFPTRSFDFRNFSFITLLHLPAKIVSENSYCCSDDCSSTRHMSRLSGQ